MGVYNGWWPQVNINETNMDFILKATKENTIKVDEVYGKYKSGELTGKGLEILGVYNTYADLTNAVQTPAIGDAYGVKTASGTADADSYTIYIWVVSDGVPQWVDFGVLRGPQGSPGTPGKDGDAATVQVIATSTLSPGSLAYARNQGDGHNAQLQFGIPRGADGDTPTISVASVETLPAGTPATVQNVGTSLDARFAFGIPRGANGEGVPSGGAAGDVLTPSGWSKVVNLVYPIGSIYLTMSTANPNTLFAGTNWERIEGRFLLGSSEAYPVTQVGGSSSHAITKDELPDIDIAIRASPTLDNPPWAEPNQVVLYRYISTEPPANMYASLGGRGNAMSIMPPYIAVNMWRRIA